MPSIVNNYNYGQLFTAAVAKRSNKLSDIITKATPITKVLFDQNRVREARAGGPELRIPLIYDQLKHQWFQGYDIIDFSPKEILSSARFNYSRVVSPFSITGDEILYTSGEQQIFDLFDRYMESATNSAKEGFEAGLVSDGTGAGGRQLLGLGAAVPVVDNAGIYGGIDRALVENWRTTTYTIASGAVPGYTTWESTNVRQIIEYITSTRSRGDSRPDLWIMDPISYRAVQGAVMATEVTSGDFGSGGWGRSSRMQRLGMDGVTFMTSSGPVDIISIAGYGSVFPAKTIFGIDTKSLALYNFPGQQWVPFHPGDGVRAMTQDAWAQGIVWSGQLALENPLFTVRIVVP